MQQDHQNRNAISKAQVQQDGQSRVVGTDSHQGSKTKCSQTNPAFSSSERQTGDKPDLEAIEEVI